jgi:hypothetical protein
MTRILLISQTLGSKLVTLKRLVGGVNTKHACVDMVTNTKHTCVDKVTKTKHTCVDMVTKTIHTCVDMVTKTKHTCVDMVTKIKLRRNKTYYVWHYIDL